MGERARRGSCPAPTVAMSSRTMIDARRRRSCASVWRTTRPSCCRLIPLASASFIASHAAAKPMKVNMLRASFIRVPAPGWPGVDDHGAHCLNAGLIRSYTSSVGADHDGQFTLLGGRTATADRRVDDVDAASARSSSASSTAVSGLIVEWIAITVPGLACAASSPTTSRTCSSLSTVTLMMSAVATSATLSASEAPDLGQRGHRLGAHVEHRSRRRAIPRAAWPSARPCCRVRCSRASRRHS